MQIILRENFPSLGYVGDSVKVKRGYARNYLIPRGIAVEATSRNAKQLKHRMEGIAARKAKLKADAEKFASQLNSVSLDFVLKLGVQGKSFGAITGKDIEIALKDKGFEVDRKQIRLPEAIKNRGEFKIEIKLHSEVAAFVTANVTVEVPAEPVKTAEENEKGGRRRGRARRNTPQEEEMAPESPSDDS